VAVRTKLAVFAFTTTLVLACPLVAGCDDGTDEPAAAGAPTSTTMVPTRDAPATVPASASAGATLAFVRENDLWAAPLDGDGEPRVITSGSVRASYAGYAVRDDGGVDLYYLDQLEDVVGLYDEADVAVRRVPLEGGEPEEVFVFPSRNASLASAAVSSDGQRLVYADGDALILRDVASGEETVLARSRYSLAGDGSYVPNDILTDPVWSPTGDMIFATMFVGNDTIMTVLVDLAPPISVTDLRFIDHRASWSADGSQLCIYYAGVDEAAGLVLYDVETHETVDLLVAQYLPTSLQGARASTGGCAWSDDGRLAASYTPDVAEPPRVCILDANLVVVDQSEPLEVTGGVVGWLPDGSGVVVYRRGADDTFSTGVYRPGEEIEYLTVETGFDEEVLP
jgi:hypothetical protein